MEEEFSNFMFFDENEKPPASTRFSHQKAVKASLEGGKVVALGVAEAEDAGHAGEHVEDDNGGTRHAIDEAPQEVRHVGLASTAQ